MSDDNPEEGANPLTIIETIAPEGWQKKLGRAFAQLVAGTRLGGALYAAGRDARDTADGRSIIARAQAEQLAHIAVSDPEQMERAKARFLGDVAAKQANLEAVIMGAAHHLKALPAPQDDPATDDRPGNNGDPLDADWAFAFTHHAEQATSDELRERLSRILAGELRAPGTYSRAVVRQIVELNRADLEAMKLAIPHRVGNCLHLSGWGDERFGVLIRLIDAGLTLDTGNNVSLSVDCKPHKDGFVCQLIGKKYVLVFTKEDSSKMMINVSPLTRAGIAVADLLEDNHEEPVMRIIANNNKRGMKAIYVAKYDIGDDGQNKWTSAEQLYPHTEGIRVDQPPEITNEID